MPSPTNTRALHRTVTITGPQNSAKVVKANQLLANVRVRVRVCSAGMARPAPAMGTVGT